jgi:aspartyl-tRNA(Asn)/glutamyl-tRNA(Gln) amidotransferase subunit C
VEINPMSVDKATVKRVARLARIAVGDDEAEALKGELNTILSFVEQLNEVDIAGVEPMTSVTAMKMKMRADIVSEGERADGVVANAPAREASFFVVPKVVE